MLRGFDRIDGRGPFASPAMAFRTTTLASAGPAWRVDGVQSARHRKVPHSHDTALLERNSARKPGPPVAPRAMSRPGDRSRATGVDAPHLPCEVDVSRDAAAIRPDRGSYGGRTREARRRRRWIHSSSLVQPGPARGARRRSGRDDLSFGGRSGRLRAPALGDAPRGRSTLEPPLDVVGFTPSTTRPRRRRETPDRLAFL